MTNVENTLQAFIAPFKRDEKDDGSPEVQVAQLTYEVTELQAHLKQHDKDVDAKKKFIEESSKKKKIHEIPKENALERYNLLVKKLGLKG